MLLLKTAAWFGKPIATEAKIEIYLLLFILQHNELSTLASDLYINQETSVGYIVYLYLVPDQLPPQAGLTVIAYNQMTKVVGGKLVMHNNRSGNRKEHSLYFCKVKDISRVSKDQLLQCSVRLDFLPLSTLGEPENRLWAIKLLDFHIWVHVLDCKHWSIFLQAYIYPPLLHIFWSTSSCWIRYFKFFITNTVIKRKDKTFNYVENKITKVWFTTACSKPITADQLKWIYECVVPLDSVCQTGHTAKSDL